ncbi:OTU domain-containing protein 7B-like isoform X1 [Schistocerca gregaria]|uniref:OTU domain-containing protein 7B-like isoform X1 n=1 Tax=Schistocerca gregaria TaxID=7010 RepID=UPI00211DC268|nr:OTU domain-containing protein 7B-like isoform X1 [Schistocerca gregaria]XP_049836558.1 OTU domain-containing protein 7B-like isoform X1 [Schistocerca gregaria]
MESQLISQFMSNTSSDTETAITCLQASGWDLKNAIELFLENGGNVRTTWEENGNIRPTLRKTPAVDLADLKKLSRGISRATDNVKLVSRARSDIAHEFGDTAVFNVNQFFIETPVCTFTLPDLTVYPEDFRSFLEKDLIEKSTLQSLESAGRLNWWVELGACQSLWPLATSGDGNCLLHAASLGMWGFHDRLLTLRRALHGFLSGSPCREALYRRWRWQQTRANLAAGLVYTEEEWQREWDSIISMASTQPRKSMNRRRSSILMERSLEEIPENATYESLEEVHVLALAHVLRRPIVVIADVMLKDMNGEDLAPIPFGGVYLPLECPPADCHRSPLVLAYDSAHFSALVVMERNSDVVQPPAAVPLISSDRQLLPIQFAVDPGEQLVWGRDESQPHLVRKLSLAPRDQLGLLAEYLDVRELPPGPDSPPESTDDGCDIEKRFSEMASDSDPSDEGVAFGGKAARQFQTAVAKQFGSLSRRLRKNFGSLTRASKANAQKKDTPLNNQQQERVICALLHTEKRHAYQAEMIRNYLACARARFELQQQKQLQPRQSFQSEAHPGSTAATFTSAPNTGVMYGAGRSRFYATEMMRPSVETLPHQKAPGACANGRTLFLAKSTFYDDEASHSYVAPSEIVSGRHTHVATLTSPQLPKAGHGVELPHVEKAGTPCRNNHCHFYGSPDSDHYCSRCYRENTVTGVNTTAVRSLQVQEVNR